MDYDVHLVCLVLQELAAAGLVRVEKADGSPAAEESSFSIPIVLIMTGRCKGEAVAPTAGVLPLVTLW
jgi:hypothetical protein